MLPTWHRAALASENLLVGGFGPARLDHHRASSCLHFGSGPGRTAARLQNAQGAQGPPVRYDVVSRSHGPSSSRRSDSLRTRKVAVFGSSLTMVMYLGR